eukprot:TRINITY_DN22014_c1_g1_i1.p1 TRINITY_DN22014_c1_g1~~TRINITY_DN22014_c1_g1_i1.p1  ORF type:complete len:224 (-),score=40.89 TRINITY_DN22014_c1_g1_i1:40-711(-)
MPKIRKQPSPIHHQEIFPSPQMTFDFSMLDEPVPLENEWSFWFDQYIGKDLSVQEYESSFRPLGLFSTVQAFWKYYNNIPAVESLGPRKSYHLMKKGIKPLWEDESNVLGGSFTFKVSLEDTPQVWLTLLLSVVGENIASSLKSGDDICGLSVSIRKGEAMFSIWNKRAELKDSSYESNLRSLFPTLRLNGCNYRVHKEETNFKAETKPHVQQVLPANQTPRK